MLFAQTMTGLDIVVIGLAILAVAFLMRRTALRGRRSQNRDLVAEVRNEFLQSESQGASRIEKLELRLYEYSREVEGRIETRIELLDQLVAAADAEAVRLEAQLRLHLENGNDNGKEPMTIEQRRMIEHLAGAGYTPVEIAGLSDRLQSEIEQILRDTAA